jgi:hypothetical protein
MALTDTALRTTKPSNKPFKLYDGNGLFLLVTIPAGRSCGVGAITSTAKRNSWHWENIPS